MARRMNKLALLLVLALALLASAHAQGPSDTNNNEPVVTTVAPEPTTAPTPTTTAPVGVVPTPTTKPTPAAGAVDAGTTGSAAGAAVPVTTTPAPAKTTATTTPPAATPATPPPGVTAATPPPAVTTVAPEILVDRTVKSEYGTRAPAANETTATTESQSSVSSMGSWLVPAVIGAVIISALIIMTFFVRSRGGGHADEDYGTPRRGSDNFMEHPKTVTNHVAVPVLEDNVKGRVASENSNMRTVPVGGALHSPRATRVASSPPLLMDHNRATSPGFGTYKQKNMEGSSVGF